MENYQYLILVAIQVIVADERSDATTRKDAGIVITTILIASAQPLAGIARSK